MIVIHLAFLISISIGSVISISGLGSLLNFKSKDEFIINFFLGYLLLGLLLILVHFFFRINLIIIVIIFLSGMFFALRAYYFSIKKIVKKHYLYFLIFLFLIPIFISQKFHEDFGYYHLPHIINLVNEKIIFGLGNVNVGFVHNSIWLNILPFFYVGTNYDFVTLPTFLLYVVFVIYSTDQIINHSRHSNSNYFLIICIFYLILKFTRISEFGNDIPALIYSILGIFFFLKYEEEDNLEKKKNIFFAHFSFVVFAILIKFSTLPIILLTLYIFIKNFKKIIKEIFKYNYIIIYLLAILFFVQQFIYTGCFVFPSQITCFDVSWFNNDFLNLGKNLELVNKSYSEAYEFISSDEYLVNFNWVPYWFKRNYLEFTEHLLTMLIPVILYLLLLSNKNNCIHKSYSYKILILFTLIGFCFWFTFSPVYRFGVLYFLSMIYIITVKFYNKKTFSKKIFLILLVIFFIFNFSKNIHRISKKNYVTFGIDNIKNDYISYNNYFTNSPISVFKPNIEANNLKGNGWQGRLCWDIPFICSYNKIKVDLINYYYVISKLN
jgi:hypothetical protein